jgi:hypothetical protein
VIGKALTPEAYARAAPRARTGSLGVGRPAEAAGLVLLDRVVDLDAGRAQLGEHRVEVTDAVIDHLLLLLPTEVLGVRREEGPHRHVALFRLEDVAAPRRRLDSEVLRVPREKGLRVAGAKEDAADPDHAFHQASSLRAAERASSP